MRPEQHFDQVKANTEQLAPVVAEAADVVRGPWVKPCLAHGPYAIRRPTPKSPFRLEVLTCTRHDGHPGPFHQHTDRDAAVIAQWHRDGRPDYPPVMRARS